VSTSITARMLKAVASTPHPAGLPTDRATIAEKRRPATAKLIEIIRTGTDSVRGERKRRPYAYAWQRDQEGIEPRPPHVYVRLREVEAVFEDNYGGKFLPDDDAGRADLFIIAQHIREFGGDIVQHIVAFAAMWARWMPEAETRALANEVIAKPCTWKADSLAKELGVTKKQRDRLGLTTIGAIDFTARQRKRMRRKQRAAADAARRLAAGAKPHAESAERTRPWEAEDISRRTWYRRKNGTDGIDGTDSRPAGVYSAGQKQCHEVKTKPNRPSSGERKERSDGTPRRQRRASRNDSHIREESTGWTLRLSAKPSTFPEWSFCGQAAKTESQQASLGTALGMGSSGVGIDSSQIWPLVSGSAKTESEQASLGRQWYNLHQQKGSSR
jgi:hypothetical protein